MAVRAVLGRGQVWQAAQAHVRGMSWKWTASPTIHSFIDGQAATETSGRPTREIINPATNKTVCVAVDAGQEEVDRAVVAAQRAQREWSRYSTADRSRVLSRVAAILRERNDELARVEALNTGRAIAETSVVDIISAIDSFQFFAGEASSLSGQYVPMPNGNFAYTIREPLGVCAGIGAWNYPIQSAAFKLAPAMACGNALVFKPAEHTPLTALELAEVVAEAGAPQGLFSVVLGDGTTGQMLSRHKDIAKVSFTGEVSTGKQVCADASGTLKAVTMELGGKSPLIIFPDADMENAVAGAMMANFYSTGQVCSNGTRVYVHTDIYDSFVQRLVERTKKLRIGDPLDPKTDVGSLINQEHLGKVMKYIELATADGCKLLCGGSKVNPASLPSHCANGAFVEPTIFANCREDMRIVKEEVFGPVMCILPFSDEEDVIQRANNTIYGLSAGVFTRDIARGHRVVARLEAGTTWINNYNLAPVELPWGGHKQSGLGRENGVVAKEFWSQLKSVYVELGDIDCPYP